MRPVALFSNKSKSSQEAFSDGEDFFSEHQQVLGNIEPLFIFSNPEHSINSFLEERTDYMIAEAKSEVREQESRADYLDNLFVIFRDNLTPIVWKSVVPIKSIKNLEKSRPDFMKNWLSEKESFEKLKSELFMKWENHRELRKREKTNSPGTN